MQFLNTITTQRPNQIIYEMSEMCVEVIWSLTVEKTLITVCSVGLNFGGAKIQHCPLKEQSGERMVSIALMLSQ